MGEALRNNLRESNSVQTVPSLGAEIYRDSERALWIVFDGLYPNLTTISKK